MLRPKDGVHTAACLRAQFFLHRGPHKEVSAPGIERRDIYLKGVYFGDREAFLSSVRRVPGALGQNKRAIVLLERFLGSKPELEAGLEAQGTIDLLRGDQAPDDDAN